MGESDPLIKDALMTIVEREGFIKSSPDDKKVQSSSKSNKVMSSPDFQTQIENNLNSVSESIKSSQTSIEELKQNIQTKSGSDLFDFILEDLPQLKKHLFDPRMGVIMDAMDASLWINKKNE